jgi:hypothetical protein
MIDDIKAIRTGNGKQVWRWGGDYRGNKDAMHFENIVSPADLATGIIIPRSMEERRMAKLAEVYAGYMLYRGSLPPVKDADHWVGAYMADEDNAEPEEVPPAEEAEVETTADENDQPAENAEMP